MTKPREQLDGYDFVRAVKNMDAEIEYSSQARVWAATGVNDTLHRVVAVEIDSDGDMVVVFE